MSNNANRLAADVADEAASAAQGIDVATVSGNRAPAPASSDSIAEGELAKAEKARIGEAEKYGIETGKVVDKK